MKRIVPLLLVLIIITVTCIPVKKADAALPLIVAGAGIEVAVGATVLSGLIVAEGLRLYGNTSNADALNTASLDLWNNAQQNIKSAITTSYNVSIAEGKAVMALSGDLLTWVKGAYTKLMPYAVPRPAPGLFGAKDFSYINFDTTNQQYSASLYSNSVDYYITGYAVYDYKTGYDTNTLKAQCNASTSICTTSISGSGVGATYNFPYNKIIMQGSSTNLNDYIAYFLGAVPSYTPILKKTLVAMDAAKTTNANAIPLTLARPNLSDMVAHPKGNLATDLVYNPTTSTYATTGGVPWTGEIDWTYPKAKVVTDVATDTKKAVIPVGGVLTDVVTGAKVGTADVPLVDVPVTGVQEITGSVSITDTGTLAEPTSQVNKFKGMVTTKFPFSLPWDLLALFGAIVATPQVPEINVDKPFTLGGYSMPFKFNISFAFLDPWMPFFRGFQIIAFCYFLIMATRKLLGGGA